MTVENTVFEQNQLSRWNDREVLHQLSRGPKLSQFYIYIWVFLADLDLQKIWTYLYP